MDLNIKGASQANIFFEILRPVLLLHLCRTHISLDPLKQMLCRFRALCKKIKKTQWDIFALESKLKVILSRDRIRSKK